MRTMVNSKHEELKEQLEKLAASGASGEDIMSQMGITPKLAKKLHYELLMAGRVPAVELEFATLGEPEVAEKGNIYITANRLERLGLKELFTPATKLKIERVGDALRIEAVPRTEGRRSVPTAQRKSPKFSGWKKWFQGSTSEQSAPAGEN